eukprot:560325-Pyramimonas_sp.AAC.1
MGASPKKIFTIALPTTAYGWVRRQDDSWARPQTSSRCEKISGRKTQPYAIAGAAVVNRVGPRNA